MYQIVENHPDTRVRKMSEQRGYIRTDLSNTPFIVQCAHGSVGIRNLGRRRSLRFTEEHDYQRPIQIDNPYAHDCIEEFPIGAPNSSMSLVRIKQARPDRLNLTTQGLRLYNQTQQVDVSRRRLNTE